MVNPRFAPDSKSPQMPSDIQWSKATEFGTYLKPDSRKRRLSSPARIHSIPAGSCPRGINGQAPAKTLPSDRRGIKGLR